MILGVSLVVNELHKGPRLVFRYPPASSYLNSSKKSATILQLEGIYEQYLTKISDSNFSKLFRPKNSLCGRVLELEIDDLHFVSFPCHCSDINLTSPIDTSSSTTTIQGSSSKTNLASADADGKQTTEVITIFNVVIATVSRKAMRRIDPRFLYRCQKGRQMSSFSAACSYPGVDPIAAAMALPDSNERAYGVCNQVLRRVVENVSNSLLQQEKKSNYVSSEVGLLFRMITLSHDLLHQYQRMAASSATTGSSDSFSHGYLAEMTVGLDNLLRGGCTSLSTTLPALTPKLSKISLSSSDSNIQDVTELLDGREADHSPGGGNSGGVASTYPSLSAAIPTSRPVIAAAPAAQASSVASSSVANSNSSTNSADIVDGGDVADEIINWGPHLLPIALKYSTLANELRILYHNLVGGHSVCISLNGQKAINIPLVCKEVKLCNDSTYISRTNSDSDGFVYGNNLWGTGTKASSAVDMTHDLPSSAANRSLGITFKTLTSTDSVGNHPIALNRSRGGHTAPSSPSPSSSDYNNSKFKGIKLRTQTMLPMADVEVIMGVLSVLDGGKINHLAVDSSAAHNAKKETDHGSVHSASEDRKDGDAISGTIQSSSAGGNKQLTKSRLYTFIEAADPTQCFLDLSMMLDEPVEELVSMATYLQSWGLAQIMSVIYSHSTYRVHELAQSSTQSVVSRIFDTFIISKLGFDASSSCIEEKAEPVRGSAEDKERETGKVDLAYVLSLFDGSRSIAVIVETLPAEVREFGLDILVFLLRYHMVTPITQHVLNLKNLVVIHSTQSDAMTQAAPNSNCDGNDNTTHCAITSSSSKVGTGITSGSGKSSTKLPRNVSFHFDIKDDEQRNKATKTTTAINTNFAHRSGGGVVSATASSSTNFSSLSWPRFHLNEKESGIYERIAPFVQHHTYSHKNIHEIMLYAKVGAKEFFDLVAKLPHLKIVSV